jgi:hypothetical protein
MRRNNLGIAVLLLCCLLFPVVGQASSLADLVDEDWAYFALAELGRGRPLGEFIIPQEMTRYQGALLVARLIEYIDGNQPSASRRFGISREVLLDQMVQDYNKRVVAEQRFDDDEVELLYRLVLEFNDELAILGYDVRDYAIILGLGNSRQLGGLFVERQLSYSSQALSAVRKAELSFAPLTVDLNSSPQESNLEETSTPTLVEDDPPEVRSLWTGAVPIAKSALPIGGTLTAETAQTRSELAALNLGGLQLSGTVRSADAESIPVEDLPHLENVTGYGFAVQYGDLYLSTIRDHYAVDSQEGEFEPQLASTSLDLSVGSKNSVLFSAGYKYFDALNKESYVNDLPAVASVGVELPITSGGTLRLGMSSLWARSAVGDELESDSPDELSVRNTAELGLSYDFENETSFRLNYRLIDFTTVNQSYGATAEFSIKF